MRAIPASGTKIVMATHDLGQARRLAGEVVFLMRGRLVERAERLRSLPHPRRAKRDAFLRGDLVI